MKKLLLPIVALTVLFGCKKDPGISNGAADSSPVTYTGKSDINSALILPEAMEYYKNIVDVVQWYASHPTNKRAGSGLDGDTVNALMAKISEISILDSNLVEKTIFDLEENERAEFLETWALIEANDLSEKLKMDTTQNATSIIADRNESFKQAFGTSNKSLDSEQEDPYWKVRRIMDLKEKQRLSDMPISSGFQKTTDADDTFWAKVISNGLLSFSIIQIAPNSLTPQTFVDRIRPSIKPGRLLIANPGGWTTTYPIVFYPNKQWFDVGHVAIMNKNVWEVPNSIDAKSNITIGTEAEFGMQLEEIYESWCKKHGLAFVGQVFDVKWVTKYSYRKIGWITIKVPYYVQEARDVDNNAMFNHIMPLIGKPYCYWYEITTAKWAAPARFICSTSAWWCAKKTSGVNIGDFYKSTIFPSGVFLSDRVRIIDNTLN